MKNVSIYSSDFSDQQDWNDLLEELDYSEDERETIEEVELSVKTAEVSNNAIEVKHY